MLRPNPILLGLFAYSLAIAGEPAPARHPTTLDTIAGSDETASGQVDVGTIAAGPFQPTWQSLSRYECPAWFRDAKFGVFMHWGLPSVVDENRPFGTGHYARGMYNQHGRGTADFCREIYDWHVARYGHPTKFGYKDFIPLWRAEHWDPDALVAFYKSIGARYIVPVAVHHDNFDIYDSTYHRWNAAKMGPKRDILGEWRRAALKYGLRFGASTHLDRAPSFLAASHGSDWEGPLKGVPYDGADPRFKDFYLLGVTSEQFQREWYLRTREIIDRYQPDLLYFDGGLPFGAYGLNLAADLYNSNLARHGGRNEAVLNLKRAPVASAYVHDIERGQSDVLRPLPWQTDTTLIGGWFYHKARLEMTASEVVTNLADIVSKNGNLLLNVGLEPDGTLPDDQRAVLEDVGRWLRVNGEAIYGTRPWTTFGEGPTKVSAGSMTDLKAPFTARDIRFTTKDHVLYVIVLGWPSDAGTVTVHSLGTAAHPGRIRSVEMLGENAPLSFSQNEGALTVTFPKTKPCAYAYVLKIDGAL